MNISEHLRDMGGRPAGSGPRYVQLRARIEEAIESGLLPPGGALPSEREIASLTGLSRVTVRKAIQALVDDGAVVHWHGPRRGRGECDPGRLGRRAAEEPRASAAVPGVAGASVPVESAPSFAALCRERRRCRRTIGEAPPRFRRKDGPHSREVFVTDSRAYAEPASSHPTSHLSLRGP